MPNPAHLLVIRHATSAWNATGRWQGWADPPLADSGVAHVREAAVLFAPHAFDLVVTSDLTRARHTGELLAAELGLAAPESFTDLRERHIGEWSGCTTDDIERQWPGMLDLYRYGKADPPGGESQAEFAERLSGALVSVANTVGRRRAIVVSHGGAIRVLVELAIVHSDTLSATANKLRSGPVKNLSGVWCSVDKESNLHVHDAFDDASAEPTVSIPIL